MTDKSKSKPKPKPKPTKKIDAPYQIYDGQDYCGSVIKTGDGFQLFDCDGNPIDTFKTLSEAMENAGGPRSEFDYYGD